MDSYWHFGYWHLSLFMASGIYILCSQRERNSQYLDSISYRLNIPEFENYLGQIYPIEIEMKGTTESNTSASYLLLSIERDDRFHSSICDKSDDFNFHISFPCLNSIFARFRRFISQIIRYAKLLIQGCAKERLKSIVEVLWPIRGSEKTIWSSLSRMLIDILWPDDITMIPSIDQTLLEIMTLLDFFRITRGYYRTFATGLNAERMFWTPGPVSKWNSRIFYLLIPILFSRLSLRTPHGTYLILLWHTVGVFGNAITTF